LQSDVVRYLCHDEFKFSAQKLSTAQRFLRVYVSADLTLQDFPFRPHSTFICFLWIK